MLTFKAAIFSLVVSLTSALLPDFSFRGDDHYKLGFAIGQAYPEAIQKRMAAQSKGLKPFLATSAGKRVFNDFLSVHNKRVPKYIDELKGISHGSNVSFETVFAVSMTEELSYFINGSLQGRDECTDYMLCNKERCMVGHNEDGDIADRELFVAEVEFGSRKFTTMNYVGDLLGGMSSFAFNDQGMAFSLNWLGPKSVTPDGLGRNFVSRMLLEAPDWESAVDVISQKHAAGHNYQLMDFSNRRIANIEAANNRYALRNIEEAFFHTNMYTTLNEPGVVSNSSQHRMDRLRQLPIAKTREDILKALGDQADHSYPIFHDKYSHDHGDLSDWTLSTAFFDLDHGVVQVMRGNPANLAVSRTFKVPTVSRKSAMLV